MCRSGRARASAPGARWTPEDRAGLDGSASGQGCWSLTTQLILGRHTAGFSEKDTLPTVEVADTLTLQAGPRRTASCSGPQNPARASRPSSPHPLTRPRYAVRVTPWVCWKLGLWNAPWWPPGLLPRGWPAVPCPHLMCPDPQLPPRTVPSTSRTGPLCSLDLQTPISCCPFRRHWPPARAGRVTVPVQGVSVRAAKRVLVPYAVAGE